MSGTEVRFHDDWVSVSSRALACPVCGFDYLHHRAVFVYGSAQEDSADLDFSIVGANGKVSETGITPRNGADWYGRRDSLLVSFWCEGCHCISALQIRQHKGLSLVEWRTEPDFDLVRSPREFQKAARRRKDAPK